MTEKEAIEILKNYIQNDGSLYNSGHYLSWDIPSNIICLDGDFESDELEAIVWWMRNKRKLND